jgi:hypothetical protein
MSAVMNLQVLAPWSYLAVTFTCSSLIFVERHARYIIKKAK